MSSARNQSRPSIKFSIRSIFVITTVFAAAAVSLGYLFRGASGKTGEIGYFVIVTMVMPLAMMVAMSWGFRVVKWLGHRR